MSLPTSPAGFGWLEATWLRAFHCPACRLGLSCWKLAISIAYGSAQPSAAVPCAWLLCRFHAATFHCFFPVLLKALGLLTIIFAAALLYLTIFVICFQRGCMECLTEAGIAETLQDIHPVPG